MMPYLSCKKIENDVYNFPTWQYCKYKDIFDSRIIINSTAKFYISISYQKDLLSIDTRIFTPSPEMFSLEAEIHHYIEILEPVLRDAGQEMWQALDRIISAKNAMEGIVAKEMYIRGFLDYERLVCEKDSKI